MTDFLEDLPSMFVTTEFATDIKIDGVAAKGIYTPEFEDAFGIETRNKELLIQESVSVTLCVTHESIVELLDSDGGSVSCHRVRGIEPNGTGLVVLTLDNEITCPDVGDFLLTAEGHQLLTSEGENIVVN